MNKYLASLVLFIGVCLTIRAADTNNNPQSAATDFPVTITVDASATRGQLTPIWRFFGYDEGDYTFMKDGKKLLSELGQLNDPQVYIRCHHLMTSGDGTPALKWSSTDMYKEDASGNPIYDWAIVDKIFDTYHERGLKPYVELGFMPEALTTHPENYPHNPPPKKRAPADAGQAWPPKDYSKWGELVYQWTKHCVDKYGADEVNKWYWETWNEPNIFYWHGSRQDYFKLYDYSTDAIRRALPTARVGGPETAGGAANRYLHDFLYHCAHETNYATGKIGSPLDFISFHAKGSPVFTNDHVRMGMLNEFRDVNGAFAAVASFPEYKKTPLVIGECDPEGCAACQGPQNGYRNGTMYSSYTAACFSRLYDLADQHDVNLQGALTWAFEFEDQPYFAGFRALTSDGLDLPVLNVFRMFSKMSGQRIAVESSSGLTASNILAHGVRETPDVSALASLDSKKITILVWHYHDDDVPGPDANIALSLNHLPFQNGSAKLTQYRIDGEHSNSYAEWQRMGSPDQPTPEQYAKLENAGHLAQLGAPDSVQLKDGAATLHLTLPRQGVSLLVLTWD